MLRNQKGFTYPLTLCLFILLSTALTIQIEQFQTEKRMFKETEVILKQDYYLLSTVELLQFQLSTDENMAMNGWFDFKDGQASYQIVELPENRLEVMISVKMTEKNAVFRGSAIYDKNLKKIIKWIEIN